MLHLYTLCMYKNFKNKLLWNNSTSLDRIEKEYIIYIEQIIQEISEYCMQDNLLPESRWTSGERSWWHIYPANICSLVLQNAFLQFFLTFIYLWDRDRAQQGEGQRVRETQNPKQAPGPELTARSPPRGSNSRTARSRPEPRSAASQTEPGRCPTKCVFRGCGCKPISAASDTTDLPLFLPVSYLTQVGSYRFTGGLPSSHRLLYFMDTPCGG